jgi:hypothetical protein
MVSVHQGAGDDADGHEQGEDPQQKMCAESEVVVHVESVAGPDPIFRRVIREVVALSARP